MFDNEDHDMKIVGETISFSKEGEVKDMKNELDFQRVNGNLLKARELGQRFAFDVCNFDKYEGETDPVICDQLRMLFAFTVDYALNSCIQSEVVASASSVAYLTTLKDIDEWFYDHLQISGSFSLYLLQVRRGQGNISLEIGEAFAELCLRDNDPNFVKLGGEKFDQWFRLCQEKIEKYDFS